MKKACLILFLSFLFAQSYSQKLPYVCDSVVTNYLRSALSKSDTITLYIQTDSLLFYSKAGGPNIKKISNEKKIKYNTKRKLYHLALSAIKDTTDGEYKTYTFNLTLNKPQSKKLWVFNSVFFFKVYLDTTNSVIKMENIGGITPKVIYSK